MKAANIGVANARDWRPEENLPRVVAVLSRARRVLCTMHTAPDGDALGSTLGLAAALRELGREVTVYNPDPVPHHFSFLPGADRIQRRLPREAAFDATVVCDAGAFHRLGPDVPAPERRGTLVNLDHHATTEPFGDVNYVDPAAAAVGVLVYKVIRGLGHAPSAESAQGIYASILTDTGSFRYSSTDPEALRIAAELVAAGVSPWEMASRIYEQQPLARVRLLAEVLQTLELGVEGKFASLTITREMIARAVAGMNGEGAGAAQLENLTDGFINHARSIEGVEVAASFQEGEGGLWQVSFRSRGAVNVAAIAQAFGGGGHHNAAGCAVAAPLAEVKARVAGAVLLAVSGAR